MLPPQNLICVPVGLVHTLITPACVFILTSVSSKPLSFSPREQWCLTQIPMLKVHSTTHLNWNFFQYFIGVAYIVWSHAETGYCL